MPKHDVYTKNFLTDVIFKIDFPPILSLVDNVPSAFQEKIASNFPVLEPIIQQQWAINIQSGSPVGQKTAKTTWKFKTKDGTRIIEINSEYVVIGIKKYTDYSEFKNFVTEIIKIIFELYPEIVINRLGLRYLNKVALKDGAIFDWDNKINKNLISPLSFVDNKDNILRSIQSFVLKVDDETLLTFRSGILNDVFPNAPVSKEYLLDYDCFTNIQFEKEEIFEKLDKYNDIITEYFEKSIDEGLRDYMME